MKFIVQIRSKISQSRRGRLVTDHGDIESPFFMPIATRGVVKNTDVSELKLIGAPILLSNAVHLYLRPGMQVIESINGLHHFMHWEGPILTDSGGFQVFSLKKLRTIKENGVYFSSPYDGSLHIFTPEQVIDIQRKIGSDIMMCLDVCPEGNADYHEVKKAVDMTSRWALRSKEQLSKTTGKYGYSQSLFAVVQGGRFKRLRRMSIAALKEMKFDGYAIGGVSVGEANKVIERVVQMATPLLPEDKPRYLMGVGRPEQIVAAVRSGVDMFDCVIPTREARHGRLYTFCPDGASHALDLWGALTYNSVNITNERFRHDVQSINEKSHISIVKSCSRAYLHHLFHISESLGYRIATLSNLEFYLELMSNIRKAIENGEL